MRSFFENVFGLFRVAVETGLWFEIMFLILLIGVVVFFIVELLKGEKKGEEQDEEEEIEHSKLYDVLGTILVLLQGAVLVVGIFIVFGTIINNAEDELVRIHAKEHKEDVESKKSVKLLDYDIEGEQVKVTFIGEENEIVEQTAKLRAYGGKEPYVKYKGVLVNVKKDLPYNLTIKGDKLERMVYEDVMLYLPKQDN